MLNKLYDMGILGKLSHTRSDVALKLMDSFHRCRHKAVRYREQGHGVLHRSTETRCDGGEAKDVGDSV